MLKNILELENAQKIEKTQQRLIKGGAQGRNKCQYGVPECCGSPAEGKCGTGLGAGGDLDNQGNCMCI